MLTMNHVVLLLHIISAFTIAAYGIQKRSTNSELYGGQFDGEGYVRDLSEQVMSSFYLSPLTLYKCNSTFHDERSLSDIYMEITQAKLQDDTEIRIRNYSYGLEPLTSQDDWFLVKLDFIIKYSVVLNYTVSPLTYTSPESSSAQVDVTNYLASVTLFFMGENIARQASSGMATGESSYSVTPLKSSAAKKIYGESAIKLVWEYYYFDKVRESILTLTYSTARKIDIFKYFE